MKFSALNFIKEELSWLRVCAFLLPRHTLVAHLCILLELLRVCLHYRNLCLGLSPLVFCWDGLEYKNLHVPLDAPMLQKTQNEIMVL